MKNDNLMISNLFSSDGGGTAGLEESSNYNALDDSVEDDDHYRII